MVQSVVETGVEGKLREVFYTSLFRSMFHWRKLSEIETGKPKEEEEIEILS